MWAAYKTTRHAMLIALALACFVVQGTDAIARVVFFTGNQLNEQCNGKSVFLQGACSGFIMGVLDSLNERVFCVDAGVTVEQANDVVKLYLHDHPEKRHLAASDLVGVALKEKFPCNAQ